MTGIDEDLADILANTQVIETGDTTDRYRYTRTFRALEYAEQDRIAAKLQAWKDLAVAAAVRDFARGYYPVVNTHQRPARPIRSR